MNSMIMLRLSLTFMHPGRLKGSSPPWTNKYFLKEIKERDFLKKSAAITKDNIDWQKFKET